MPSQYDGIPNDLALPNVSPVITGASNASPIVIQTSTPHGGTTGDVVDVFNIRGNSAANGRWIIQVVDTTHFALYFPGGTPSVGNGAFTSGFGGFLFRNFGATFQIPSDGDADDAATFNPAYEALGDRTAWAAMAFGGAPGGGNAWMINQQDIAYQNDGVGNTVWSTTATTTTPTTCQNAVWTIPYINLGDYLEFDFQTGAANDSSGNPVQLLGLYYNAWVPGASPGTYTKINGTNVLMNVSATGVFPLTLKGLLKLTGSAFWGAGNNGGNINLAVGAQSFSGTGTVFLTGDYVMRYKVWRQVAP